MEAIQFSDPRRRVVGWSYLLAFIACIPASNLLIQYVGTVCLQDGPCLIPVAPGVLAPTGVVVIGAALVLRDFVQRLMGVRWTILSILVGGVLTAFVAPLPLSIASTTAFIVSELSDFAIFTPLHRRSFVTAVVASSIVGLIVDSVIFLSIAFGDLEFLVGQIIGKAWAVLFSLPVIYWARSKRRIPESI